jgi:hypothetical protein
MPEFTSSGEVVLIILMSIIELGWRDGHVVKYSSEE